MMVILCVNGMTFFKLISNMIKDFLKKISHRSNFFSKKLILNINYLLIVSQGFLF